MEGMKSGFIITKLTHPLSQVVLTAILLAIGVSIACVANKSASSTASTNAPVNRLPDQPASSVQQTNATCSLTKAAAPALNGLRLGMTQDEVLALFPGSKEDEEVRSRLSRPANPLGVSDFMIRPAKFESKDKFAGVNQISFNFLDGRVSTVNLSYNGPVYSHVDEFVAKFVAGRALPPPDQWQPYAGMDTQLKVLTCKDFEIRVFAGTEGGASNYVLMKDLELEKELKDRRAKARAKASPSPR
jgi:hypothetical protein